MSQQWKRAWTEGAAYWAENWRRWWGLGAIGGGLVLLWWLANPEIVPFLFFRVEPFNDPVIGQAFSHNVMALSSGMPRVAFSGVVLLLAGVIIGYRRGGRLSALGFLAAGILAVVTLVVLAVAGVPVGRTHVNVGWTMAIDFLLVIFVVPLIFWWWPWALTHSGDALGHYGVWFTHNIVEKVGMALVWLLGVAVAQMLAAATSWATFSPFLGEVVLAAGMLGHGFFCWRTAYRYAQLEEDRPKLAQG